MSAYNDGIPRVKPERMYGWAKDLKSSPRKSVRAAFLPVTQSCFTCGQGEGKTSGSTGFGVHFGEVLEGRQSLSTAFVGQVLWKEYVTQ